jgi:hypothetical protein
MLGANRLRLGGRSRTNESDTPVNHRASEHWELSALLRCLPLFPTYKILQPAPNNSHLNLLAPFMMVVHWCSSATDSGAHQLVSFMHEH